jgi:GDPmannose 4,6-dehydratase
MRRALITGITGQDGHHLTQFLQSMDYEVFGLVNGQRNSREHSFSRLYPNVKLLRGDLTDFSSLLQVVDDVQPDEIYNFSNQS